MNLRGYFIPNMVDNGKGVTRSQLLGIEGLTPEQQQHFKKGSPQPKTVVGT